MDIADKAQIEQERAMARFERSRAATPAAEPRVDCVSCGFEIPKNRREAIPGVQTCVECQVLIERGVMRL